MAPTHLHPNSWAFLCAYQIVMDKLDMPLSRNLFFALFTSVRSQEKSWVSLRASVKALLENFFSLYLDCFKDFKDHFVYVVAMKFAVKNRLFIHKHVQVTGPRLPLSWEARHYSLPPNKLLTLPENLDAIKSL